LAAVSRGVQKSVALNRAPIKATDRPTDDREPGFAAEFIASGGRLCYQ
jgi:hypothetical protein